MCSIFMLIYVIYYKTFCCFRFSYVFSPPGLENFDGSEYLFSIFCGAKNYIFAYFKTDFSFPAITMLNLEVRPDYYYIFLGTQARLFIFKFLAARIFISKNCQPPSSPNQMAVPLVHIALNVNITSEATPN